MCYVMALLMFRDAAAKIYLVIILGSRHIKCKEICFVPACSVYFSESFLFTVKLS